VPFQPENTLGTAAVLENSLVSIPKKSYTVSDFMIDSSVGGDCNMNMPKDPVILLSFVNTRLRNQYPSLEELCKSLDVSSEELTASLAAIDCYYQPEKNQFL
jgi:hypothetical protein